ncbi:zinc finger protein 224-like [Malaya genurostris]|uniref:zinc finger protein 224-like n=1 Tax=Malaya genurostris TaxID=325434 RepID=UPI0026F3EEA3|nr:zinc finger protein 224-like [Malaya genurostris]
MMSSENSFECDTELLKKCYVRRNPLCRLCLQQYPKDQLVEIFVRGSNCKRIIFSAVGIKPRRKDRSTGVCLNCNTMLDVIVNFQQICQRTNQLLNQKVNVQSSDWKEAFEAIDTINKAVKRYHSKIFNSDYSFNNAIKPDISDLIETQKDELNYGEKNDDGECQVQPVSIEMNTMYEDADYQNYDLITEILDESKHKKCKSRRQKPNIVKSNDKVMCDNCGKLISQVCLEGHLNRHLGVKPFVCEIEGCGRRLHSKYSLQQHRHLHKSIMRFYDCQYCGKRIKGTSSWLRHKKMHTEDPKFCCEVCGKKFRRRSNLKLHSVVHTGVALYPCEICGKRFTVKHNLGAHYKMHKRNGTYTQGCQPQQQSVEIDLDVPLS